MEGGEENLTATQMDNSLDGTIKRAENGRSKKHHNESPPLGYKHIRSNSDQFDSGITSFASDATITDSTCTSYVETDSQCDSICSLTPYSSSAPSSCYIPSPGAQFEQTLNRLFENVSIAEEDSAIFEPEDENEDEIFDEGEEKEGQSEKLRSGRNR